MHVVKTFKLLMVVDLILEFQPKKLREISPNTGDLFFALFLPHKISVQFTLMIELEVHYWNNRSPPPSFSIHQSVSATESNILKIKTIQ